MTFWGEGPAGAGAPPVRGGREGVTTRRRLVALLAVVFLLAVALRLGFLAEVHDEPLYQTLIQDEASYDRQAREIAEGGWIGRQVFYQSPLYPYFVAVIYSGIHESATAVRIVQALLGGISCILVFLAGRRLFGVGPGLLAALLAAFYGTFIFHDSLILKESLSVFVSSLLLLLLALGAESPSTWPWLTSGAALGVLALLRGNTYLYVPILLVWIALRQRRRLRASLALLAGLAAIVGPVTARNLVVGKDFVISESQGGTNFYIGNNPAATGTYVPLLPGRGSVIFEREDARRIASAEAGRQLRPSEVSRYWYGKAWRFIKEHPSQFLRLTARKIHLFFSGQEIPDVKDFYYYRRTSLALRLGFVSFSLVLALGAIGLGFSWHGRSRAEIPFLLTAAAAVAVVPFYVFSRYRLPAVPPLLVLGGFALWRIQEAARMRRWRTVAVSVGGCVIVIFLVNARRWPVGSSLTLHNSALALAARGDTEGALKLLAAAIALDPDNGVHYCARGPLLEEQGLTEAALDDYSRCARLAPGVARAHVRKGDLEAALGRYDEAVADYTRAIDLEPADAELRNARGIALASKGDLRSAMRDFLAAVLLDRLNLGAMQNIENVSAAVADDAKAREAFERDLDRGSPPYDRELVKGFHDLAAGRLDSAISAFSRASTLREDDAAARAYRGLAYLRKEEPERAIVDLRGAVERDPGRAELYRLLALAYRNAGDAGGTLENLDTAITLSPEDPLYRIERGTARARSGQLEGALRDFTTAIALNRRDAQVYRLRAGVYRLLNRSALALADEERAEKLDGKTDPK